MRQATMTWIDIPAGRIGVDPESGAVAMVRLTEPKTHFVRSSTGRGLLRLAVPLPDYPSHFIETGIHGRPEVEHDDGTLQLTYRELASKHHRAALHVEITFTPADDGLVLRARVHNAGSERVPQVLFPRLLGLEPIGGTSRARLQLGRRRILPFQELRMRPDDAWWLDRGLQTYVPYGAIDFAMKWLDYGDSSRGLTLYSRDPRYTTQGLVVARPDRGVDRVDIHWAHYPFIEPGTTWDSGDYVLLVHPGDWYAGARAYRSFAAARYPYRAPRRIQEALGIRSVWPAVRNAPPTFPIDELPEYAAEIADPDLGLAELCVWHWWVRNGYPIVLDPRLGTEDDLRNALRRCREAGVPVSLFVSHHLVRNGPETDAEWLHLDATGQAVTSDWTYGPGFLPVFPVAFLGTHTMTRGSALSSGWRETGLQAYRRLLDLGATSICFDQFSAWPEPNLNPTADGRPDEEGERLLAFGNRARALIRTASPGGTFSGEHVTDVKVPVLDYSWEWCSAHQLADAAPFRYVFPQFRLNANVNEHSRGALLAFMEGALLNVMPGSMHSRRLADCPELLAVLRKLARLRRRFLRYFTAGQFRFLEGLRAHACAARLYTHGDDVLVITANPTDRPVEAAIEVDPTVWGRSSRPTIATVYDLDSRVVDATPVEPGTTVRMSLTADDLRVVEFARRQEPAA
ncbi:DUF6259 domain-containing protein [Jiangella asiatica]|uniref:Glycosyl hydrolase family 13 catalytic domain-containing protein n=1 Tax=Jiangella asiatica TaxID=2530372 RepID=A0A4V2Z328_9ACTN|nr:DUF6259 domain-containing protein [Jiangella asiatica]TDE11188.1 hypothetical protein E1269_09960 [Jiangella asiatica]